jgi:hypothetical protein
MTKLVICIAVAAAARAASAVPTLEFKDSGTTPCVLSKDGENMQSGCDITIGSSTIGIGALVTGLRTDLDAMGIRLDILEGHPSIDDCTNHQCVNGGTCVDGTMSYTCDCPAGYTGTYCETDIDECASNPCGANGACTDLVNAFSCACNQGWEGTTCGTATKTYELLTTPQNIRVTCGGDTTTLLDTPAGVPADAKAILVSPTTYDASRNDHSVHTFGRKNDHDSHVWDNRVYDLNAYLNDVAITHHGDSNADNGYYYGHSYGTQIIPLDDNGQVRARLCLGQNQANTAYITLQVYGYVPRQSIVDFVSKPENIRTTCDGQTTQTLSPPSNIPKDAKAVFATITTYSDNRNDHWVASFGRDSSHDTHTWDNRVYDLDTYLNDVMVTHEGDSSFDAYYGTSHGASTIPLDSNGKIQANLCMGHNRNNRAYITMEVYGYIPASNARVSFVSTPDNVRFTCSGASKKTLSVPSNIPSTAKAVYATVSTYQSNNDDHYVHSFGRDNNHDSYTWDNRVYDLNTYLNDVMLTHEGNSAGNMHYGHSFGSHLIPLDANGKIQSYACMGHDNAATAYATLQIFGYQE